MRYPKMIKTKLYEPNEELERLLYLRKHINMQRVYEMHREFEIQMKGGNS